MQPSLENFLQETQQRVNQALEKILPPETEYPQHLHKAMRYSVFNGGKRIRPALVYATGNLFQANATILDNAACAIELIHAFSLVHDDLPAMDNDTLRRGKPTCHIAFDEATAILTGDALQSLAFQCLANTKLSMVNILATASGSQGMAGGQAQDMAHVGQTLDLPALKKMHAYKTGALIKAAVMLGALAAENVTEEQLQHLSAYAEYLGLAFQVQDDILDVEAATDTLGKTSGKDAQNNKPTFPGLLGIAEAKQYTQKLHAKAIISLSIFNEQADSLRTLAAFAIQRKY